MSDPVRWRRLFLSAAVAAVALVVSPAAASAQPCPEVELVFARGQDEPPGMGMVGDAVLGGLRDRTGKQIAVYAVNYPARAADIGPGVADMSGHISAMVANCPDTKLVVGGYSLGGAVTNEVLANRLPPDAGRHIVAVLTFGNASRLVGAPLSPGPQYDGKTFDMCNPGDPICSTGNALLAHLQLVYIVGGGPAIDFAASRL
jgi:cutinase